MQTATAQNQVPPHLRIGQNQSEVVIERVEDKSLKTVFFAGDVLTLTQKQIPAYKLGGKLFPEAHCLQSGVVSRCAITPLKQGMMSVHSNLIDQKERKNYIQSYTATNVFNPSTGQFENLRVGVSGASADLLYKPIYPVQEVGSITGAGVVQIFGLEDAKAIKEAQLFYFPDWIDIISGKKALPTILRELEDHLRARLAQAPTAVLQGVGESMLLSCSEYRQFGTEYIATQTALIEDAKKFPGVIQRYDEIAERFFIQLELTRQDSLIQDFAKNQNLAQAGNSELSQAIALLTQIVAKQTVANAVPAESAVAAEAIIPDPADVTAAEFEQSLEPSVADEVAAIDCDFPKEGGCKGKVLPGTTRCVAHRDK